MAEAGFEAEVRGAFARSVQGDAVEDSLGGAGVMVDLGMNAPAASVVAFRLESSDAEDTFYIIGTVRGEFSPGTYPIERAGRRPFDGERTGFVALYRFDSQGGGAAVSDSGTLTITQASEGEVVGAFEFDAIIFDRDVKDENAEPDLQVEGDFRAQTRRRSIGQQ